MVDSPIGLIGVGLLGAALAERMLAAGFDVLGHDLSPAAGDRLRALGGRFAISAQELADSCATMVLCLPDSNVVEAVMNELADRFPESALVIDATTGDPDQTEAIARGLSLRGIGYVDATIAGSSEQVRRGDATVII